MLISPRSSALLAGLLLSAVAIPPFAAGQQVVNAELWNKPDGSQGITLSTDHVKPGVILFKVKNISTDEDDELLLVKADSPDGLPMEHGDETTLALGAAALALVGCVSESAPTPAQVGYGLGSVSE